eukprot:m.346712 g.346712  ORF g.346712 m.346712 type:complete len:439 (-) comp29989_c0_seq1:93-1409(-)
MMAMVCCTTITIFLITLFSSVASNSLNTNNSCPQDVMQHFVGPVSGRDVSFPSVIFFESSPLSCAEACVLTNSQRCLGIQYNIDSRTCEVTILDGVNKDTESATQEHENSSWIRYNRINFCTLNTISLTKSEASTTTLSSTQSWTSLRTATGVAFFTGFIASLIGALVVTGFCFYYYRYPVRVNSSKQEQEIHVNDIEMSWDLGNEGIPQYCKKGTPQHTVIEGEMTGKAKRFSSAEHSAEKPDIPSQQQQQLTHKRHVTEMKNISEIPPHAPMQRPDQTSNRSSHGHSEEEIWAEVPIARQSTSSDYVTMETPKTRVSRRPHLEARAATVGAVMHGIGHDHHAKKSLEPCWTEQVQAYSHTNPPPCPESPKGSAYRTLRQSSSIPKKEEEEEQIYQEALSQMDALFATTSSSSSRKESIYELASKLTLGLSNETDDA